MAARAIAVVALLGLTGCRCGPTSQPGGASLVIRLEPFGSALRGQVVDRPLRFLNPGASPVRVSALEVRGAGAFTALGPSELDVPAGGEESVVLRFAPTWLGAHAGTVHFVRGDTGQPDVVRLDALAVGPAAQLDPSWVDLGAHELYGGRGVTASALLTVRNLGLDTQPPRADAALRLSFDVPGNAARELCVGDCLGTELVLPAGALAQVPITFTGRTAGFRQWDVRVRSNDALAPVRTVRVQVSVVARPTCQFQLSPNGLAFGALRPPASLERELELENVGSEPCDVTSVELAPEFPPRSANVFTLVDAPGPQSLAPGGRLRLTVRASDASRPPAVPAPVEGAVIVHLNHPDGPARAPLSVVLQQLCLVLEPTPVDLGVVRLGCRSDAQALRAWNVCTAPLTVTSATVPAAGPFSLGGPLPATLAPGASVELTARFSPMVAGVARGVGEVAWLEGQAPRLTSAQLQGEATAGTHATDTFPPQPNKLDVLLVLDQSASMLSHQPKVAAELPRLLHALQAANVDFHLGVIGADAQITGPVGLRRLTSGERWLTSATPDAAARFGELTAWLEHSGIEGCASSALNALTGAAIASPAFNAGFLRPDAALSIVCVADFIEGDAELAQLQALKPAGRLTWDEVGALPSSTCTSGGFLSRSAYAVETGGQTLDVCASGWSAFFDTIAARQAYARTFFPLRSPADGTQLGGMTVTVAGQVVPPTLPTGATAWWWDAAANAVRLAPLYGAAPADAVSITYPLACLP